jgi:hypothetical protein
MPTNMATVECVNSTRCRGTVNVTLSEDLESSSLARSYGTVVGHRENQTCDCRFSDEDLGELIRRARIALQG